MTEKRDAKGSTPVFDPFEIGREWFDMATKAQNVMAQYVNRQMTGGFTQAASQPDPMAIGRLFASLLSDVASQVEHILAAEFRRQKLDPKTAPIYAQMLVGMVALTGQWWVDSRKFKKADVAAHLVNLAWNGLAGMEPKPILRTAAK